MWTQSETEIDIFIRNWRNFLFTKWNESHSVVADI